MAITRKYEKYLTVANKEAAATWECMEGSFQDVLFYDNRFNEEAPSVIAYGLRYAPGYEGAGTLVKFPDHEELDLPHAHSSAEHFIYLGTDPDHPDDLGGTFKIWLGKEEDAKPYTITKPTCVFMPPNTVHLPLIYKEVHKPFGVLVVMDTPMRALYNVDILPPGFQEELKTGKAVSRPASGAKKYAHCILERDPQETDYIPSHKGKSHVVIRQDLRKHPQATNTIEANLVYGGGIGWGCGDIMHFPKYKAPSLPHKHAWVENYIFMGIDPKRPGELGGTVEFWIGEGSEAEQYIISKPTIVLVPKNTVHLPLFVREVHNPFLLISTLDNSLMAELPVSNYPPGFQHIAKNG